MSKRGAKPIAPAESVAPALDGELLAQRDQQIAVMNQHQQQVIEQFGDGLPWSLEHYESEIRADIGRSAESFLRAGRRLLVARSCANHGEWGGMLQRLKLGDDTALHMMAWARQIGGVANPERVRDLTSAATTIGRMIELAKLPPEQFQELAEHGKTGELELDDVAVMSRDELRAAVREARIKLEKEAAAKSKAITAASETSAKLQKLQLTLPQRNPDAVLRDMLRELGGRVRDMQEATSALVDGIDTITRHADENGLTVDDDMGATVVNAIRSLIGFIADLKTLRGIDAPARFIAVVLPDIGEPS